MTEALVIIDPPSGIRRNVHCDVDRSGPILFVDGKSIVEALGIPNASMVRVVFGADDVIAFVTAGDGDLFWE